MLITIDLPEPLAEQLTDYLKTHPQETLVSLVQDALVVKLSTKDNSKLLKFAGIVTDAPCNARDHAEDEIH